MTTLYSHRQPGRGFTAMIMALMLLLVVLFAWSGLLLVLLGALLVLAVLLLLFHSLLVEVDRRELRLRFGIGVIGKRFRIADIRDAYPVRNKWWYGLGIRLTPHGWLYCVSGLDAVEIVLRSGKARRIGTDEPRALVAALQEAMRVAAAASGRPGSA